METERQKAIVRAMAAGLKKGDAGRHLMTFHPSGGQSSAEWFQADLWLAFNMLQSGHGYNHANYERIARDYDRTADEALHGRRARLRGPPRRVQRQEWLPRSPRDAQARPVLVAVCRCPRTYLRLP